MISKDILPENECDYVRLFHMFMSFGRFFWHIQVNVMIIDINDDVSRTFIELLGLGLEDGVHSHSLPINNMNH